MNPQNCSKMIIQTILKEQKKHIFNPQNLQLWKDCSYLVHCTTIIILANIPISVHSVTLFWLFSIFNILVTLILASKICMQWIFVHISSSSEFLSTKNEDEEWTISRKMFHWYKLREKNQITRDNKSICQKKNTNLNSFSYLFAKITWNQRT